MITLVLSFTLVPLRRESLEWLSLEVLIYFGENTYSALYCSVLYEYRIPLNITYYTYLVTLLDTRHSFYL